MNEAFCFISTTSSVALATLRKVDTLNGIPQKTLDKRSSKLLSPRFSFLKTFQYHNLDVYSNLH
jgi:hypothetical protein